MQKISKRLETVASFLLPGETIIDIGADHAYLLLYLLERDVFKKGIAIELHDGPYESAKKNINQSEYVDQLEVRWGDGLHPIAESEIESIVIAGMGGQTISRIINENADKAKMAQQLVLQPQNSPDRVRKTLFELGFLIDDETLIREDNRLYLIISARHGDTHQEANWQNLQIGPKLLEKGSEFLVEYMQSMLDRKVEVLGAMQCAQYPESGKISFYQEDIEKLRKLIGSYEMQRNHHSH